MLREKDLIKFTNKLIKTMKSLNRLERMRYVMNENDETWQRIKQGEEMIFKLKEVRNKLRLREEYENGKTTTEQRPLLYLHTKEFS